MSKRVPPITAAAPLALVPTTSLAMATGRKRQLRSSSESRDRREGANATT